MHQFIYFCLPSSSKTHPYFYNLNIIKLDKSMNQSINLFRSITNDFQTSVQEITKFLNWGKGDLQQALNYYFHKIEKKKPMNAKQQNKKVESIEKTEKIEVQEDVFRKMKKASIKQKATEQFINQVRRQYQLPIQGRKTIANADNSHQNTQKANQDHSIDEEFEDADYIPSVFNVEDEKQYEPPIQHNNRYQNKNTLNKKELKRDKQVKIQSSMQEEKQQKMEIEIHESNSFKQKRQQIQFTENQLYLGQIKIRGFALEFKNIICPSGTPIDFRYHIDEEKRKKSSKSFKKTQKTMVIRVVYSGQQFGRIDQEEVRVLVPLIVHKMIRVELYALDIPKKIDTFAKLMFVGKIYLLKKAISTPVVQTFEGHSDLIVSIYKGVGQQILGLFQKLGLQIITWPLIKKKSKYRPNKQPAKIESSSLKDQNANSPLEGNKIKQEDRKLTDPFYKVIQKSISEMINFIPKQNIKNTQTTIQTQQSAVKKKIVELKAIEEDKCAQLIDLYEEDLEPFYPPDCFISQLYSYQALALSWMLRREGNNATNYQQKEEIHPLWTQYAVSNSKYRLFLNQLTSQISVTPPMSRAKCFGGILADEMGLGKTVMMAALITTNKHIKRQKDIGNNLVIAPLTLLSQWQSQIKKHTKGLKPLIYYSTDRKKFEKSLHEYDVIITTYGTISNEYAKGFHIQKMGLYRYKWHRIILDQAHYIKGRVIQIAKAVYEIQGRCRWCLTGTPIQNSLTDLFSLIHFIRYTPWSEYQCWNKYINKPHENRQENVYEVLRSILKRVFLRRTKASKDHLGNPIVELPNKVSKIQILQMSERQRKFYDGVYQSSKRKLEELEELGILETKYMQILQILMRLRQICCHPLLYKSISKFISDPQKFQNELRRFIKKRQAALEASRDQNFEQNYFEPIIEEDEQRRVQIFETNMISETYLEQTLKKIASKQFENCLICLNEVEDPVVTSCLHIFCKVCAVRQIEQCNICSACRRRLTKQDFLHLPRQNRFNQHLEDEDKYFRSTKIIALMQHLKKMKADDKAVVFSQFLGMLDLIQKEVKLEKIKYVRMEGITSHKDRTKIVDAFQNDPTVQIFIVSLKTAGVGLNLVAANKVFMIDPWWNPGVEDQAIERVHRIGQKREVEVIRFIMDKSIQMRMLELNSDKKKLSNLVINQQNSSSQESRMQQLKYLMEKY